MRTCSIIGLFFLICLIQLANAEEIEQDFDQTILSGVWRTTGASLEARRGDFNRLFEALADSLEGGATIPVQMVAVEESDRLGISSIANRLNIYGGAYPGKLTRLYCLLNEGMCFENRPLPLRPGQKIILPDISIEEITQHKPYSKHSDESISAIITSRGGCLNYDENCQRYLFNLNIFNPKAVDYDSQRVRDDFKGELMVPTRSYIVRLNFGLNGNDKVIGEFLNENYGAGQRQPVKNWQQPHSKAKYSGLEQQNRKGSDAERLLKLEEAREQLSPNIYPEPISKPKKESTPQGSEVPTDSTNRDNILDLINHPFAHEELIPEPPDFMYILLLDGWVDQDHCEFDESVVIDVQNDQEMGAAIAELRNDHEICGFVNQSATKTIDHGTHVLSLISAKVGSNEGPGANPSIRIITNQISTLEDSNFNKHVAEAIKTRFREDKVPFVINMSFTYPTSASVNQTDMLSDEILRSGAPLYVVSAGNEGSEIGPGTCTRLPPCIAGKTDNLINVAALDNSIDNPELLQFTDIRTNQTRQSNYGPWVHVGAPADDVLGAITGHMVGKFSGTSQAAPLVSAVAAMVWTEAGGPFAAQPWQIRDRIIVSSDLFVSLPSSKLLGGRLNARRALELKHAVIEYESDQGITEIRGELTNGDMQFYLIDVKTSLTCGVFLRSVLRLHKNTNGHTYEVFIRRDSNDANFLWALNNDQVTKARCQELFPSDELIRRRIFVARATLDQEIQLRPAEPNGLGAPQPFNLRQVIDYVAKFDS